MNIKIHNKKLFKPEFHGLYCNGTLIEVCSSNAEAIMKRQLYLMASLLERKDDSYTISKL